MRFASLVAGAHTPHLHVRRSVGAGPVLPTIYAQRNARRLVPQKPTNGLRYETYAPNSPLPGFGSVQPRVSYVPRERTSQIRHLETLRFDR